MDYKVCPTNPSSKLMTKAAQETTIFEIKKMDSPWTASNVLSFKETVEKANYPTLQLSSNQLQKSEMSGCFGKTQQNGINPKQRLDLVN